MAATVWAVFWQGLLTAETEAALLGKRSPADRAHFLALAAREKETSAVGPAGGENEQAFFGAAAPPRKTEERETPCPCAAGNRLRLRRAERARQFLLSRALLTFAWKESLGSHTPPVLGKRETGQPYFPSLPERFLSISHTEGAALLALADTPVGVDIERIRPVPPRLGRSFPGTEESFWQCWTALEAAAKRDGRGIGDLLPAARREFLLRGENPSAAGGTQLPDAAPLPVADGFAAALCGAGPYTMRTVTVAELER